MVSLSSVMPDLGEKEVARDRCAEGLLYAQIFGATFLQKLAVPIGGSEQIYVGLVVMLGATLAGFTLRRLVISGARLALLSLMAGGLILTQLLGARDFSVSSLFLLLVAHMPYAFRLNTEYTARPGAALEFFQKIMVIMAILGIVQFAAQHFMPWQYVFPLDSLLPKSFIFAGFHGLNPISIFYKSTGMFMLEPAIFSQMLAVAIIIELVRGASWVRILLYACAMFYTFSGTGFVILGLVLPVFLIQRRKYGWLAFLTVVALGGLWVPGLGIEQIARLNEFSNSETSAYARFISIFRLIDDMLLSNAHRFFFGMGAGSIKETVGHFHFAIHDPSWGKIVYEYGLLGFLLYFPLMIAVFTMARCSRYIKSALAIQFFFLGEYVLSPTVHGLILGFMAWPSGQAPFSKEET